MAYLGCTSIHCPRLSNPDLPISIPASEMNKDARGNYWCNSCTKHYTLMNWAESHHYPAVRVQGQSGYWYALVADYADWFTSVALGYPDMINALYAALIEQAEQEQQV